MAGGAPFRKENSSSHSDARFNAPTRPSQYNPPPTVTSQGAKAPAVPVESSFDSKSRILCPTDSNADDANEEPGGEYRKDGDSEEWPAQQNDGGEVEGEEEDNGNGNVSDTSSQEGFTQVTKLRKNRPVSVGSTNGSLPSGPGFSRVFRGSRRGDSRGGRGGDGRGGPRGFVADASRGGGPRRPSYGEKSGVSGGAVSPRRGGYEGGNGSIAPPRGGVRGNGVD